MLTVTRYLFYPIVLCIMVLCISERDRNKLLSFRWMAKLEGKIEFKEAWYWPAFWIIMFWGVFARCYRFLELPRGLNQDGMMAAVEAFCLLRDGTDQWGMTWPTYFEAWGYSQMSTLYSYLMIPFVKILGLNKLALRLPMLLVSVAVLPIIWDFARRILDRYYALFALLLVATNPWQIIQSRWALEANLMPHVLLTAMYLLYIGREKRWVLYLSMVFFGLAPYAYGMSSFSLPILLLIAAGYYLMRKKVNMLDVCVCVAVFAIIVWPYYYTMIINAFGLETMMFGPFTLPYFAESNRTNDIAFMSANPYLVMLQNLYGHASTYLFGSSSSGYNAISWAHSMYRFMPPVFIWGAYRMWRDRRVLVVCKRESSFKDAALLLFLWYGGAVINGAMVGGVINRNNAVFYPLMFFAAYGMWKMSKKLRTAAALIVAMVGISFTGLNVTYFTDEDYQNAVAYSFREGIYEALVDTWDWDYDYYYMTYHQTEPKMMEGTVMFAHQIDYSARVEETPLNGPDGQPIDWYYTERYRFIDDIAAFELDPMECAVYIVLQSEKSYFNSQEYLIWDYGNYAVAYPRYWAE